MNSILRQFKNSMKFPNEAKEAAYEKECSSECLNLLLMQCLHYSIFFTASLCMELLLQQILTLEEYDGKYLIKVQLLTWLSLFLLVYYLKRRIHSFEDQARIYKISNLIGILIVIFVNFLGIVNTYNLEGYLQAAFIHSYLAHTFIFGSLLIKNWLIQIPIAATIFSIYFLSYYQKALDNQKEYTVILACMFGFFIWTILSNYEQEKFYRKVFSLRSELLKEKSEFNDFFLNIVHYNSQTNISILNAKAKKLMEYTECLDFDIFARNTFLKENGTKTLFNIINQKISYFKRYSARHPSATTLPHISEDFHFNSSNPSLPSECEDQDFEIHFYWKQIDEESVTLLIDDKGKKELLREEKMANKSKNTMLRALSHNLKTPLNGLLSFLYENLHIFLFLLAPIFLYTKLLNRVVNIHII